MAGRRAGGLGQGHRPEPAAAGAGRRSHAPGPGPGEHDNLSHDNFPMWHSPTRSLSHWQAGTVPVSVGPVRRRTRNLTRTGPRASESFFKFSLAQVTSTMMIINFNLKLEDDYHDFRLNLKCLPFGHSLKLFKLFSNISSCVPTLIPTTPSLKLHPELDDLGTLLYSLRNPRPNRGLANLQYLYAMRKSFQSLFWKCKSI